MKDIQFQSWTAQLPEFQSMRDKCIIQITNLITIKSPDNFDQKISLIKQAIARDYTSFKCQSYYDVLTYLVEQRVNFTLDQLAKLFVEYFGTNKEFWSSNITIIASSQYFSQKLTIWHVREQYAKYMNLSQSPAEIGAIRSYRKRAKQYLSALDSVIDKLNKLKITDSVQGIQNLYQKFHKEKAKYEAYIHKQGIPSQLQEETNFSRRRRQEAQSKLYNFPLAAKTATDFSFGVHKSKLNNNTGKNTLMKYNFNVDKNDKNKSKYDKSDILRDKSSQQYKELHNYFQNLSKNQSPFQNNLQNLRKQYQLKTEDQQNQISRKDSDSSKQHDPVSLSKSKSMNPFRLKKQSSQTQVQSSSQYRKQLQQQSNSRKHFTSIWNEQFYFFYQGCPFSQKKIDYTQPFKQYSGINYLIDSETEFQEIDGDEIQSNQNRSEFEELNQSQIKSLINDQPDIDPEATIMTFQNLLAGQRWLYNHRYYQQMPKFDILQIHTQHQVLDLQITEAQIKRKKQQRQRRKNKNLKTNQSKSRAAIQEQGGSTSMNNKCQNQNQEQVYNKQPKQYGEQQTTQIEFIDLSQILTIPPSQQNQLNCQQVILSSIKQETVQSSKLTSINNISNSKNYNINQRKQENIAKQTSKTSNDKKDKLQQGFNYEENQDQTRTKTLLGIVLQTSGNEKATIDPQAQAQKKQSQSNFTTRIVRNIRNSNKNRSNTNNNSLNSNNNQQRQN